MRKRPVALRPSVCASLISFENTQASLKSDKVIRYFIFLECFAVDNYTYNSAVQNWTLCFYSMTTLLTSFFRPKAWRSSQQPGKIFISQKRLQS